MEDCRSCVYLCICVCVCVESGGDGCRVGGQTHGQGVDVDDHEVKGHGEAHGAHQPAVAPGRHAHQGLVLRQAGGGRWGWMGRRRGTLMCACGGECMKIYSKE